jgi:hypothetical protein
MLRLCGIITKDKIYAGVDPDGVYDHEYLIDKYNLGKEKLGRELKYIKCELVETSCSYDLKLLDNIMDWSFFTVGIDYTLLELNIIQLPKWFVKEIDKERFMKYVTENKQELIEQIRLKYNEPEGYIDPLEQED